VFSTLAPAGPAAAAIAALWWAMLAGATLLFALVMALLWLAFRRRTLAHVSERGWLVQGGLVLPAIVLAPLAATALASAIMDRSEANRPFFYSILTGTALLYMLNRMRPSLSMDAMRVLADVAMLAPVLLFIAFDRQ
jgi:hypothetical protein